MWRKVVSFLTSTCYKTNPKFTLSPRHTNVTISPTLPLFLGSCCLEVGIPATGRLLHWLKKWTYTMYWSHPKGQVSLKEEKGIIIKLTPWDKLQNTFNLGVIRQICLLPLSKNLSFFALRMSSGRSTNLVRSLRDQMWAEKSDYCLWECFNNLYNKIGSISMLLNPLWEKKVASNSLRTLTFKRTSLLLQMV